MQNVLANCCLFTHPAHSEQHQHSFGCQNREVAGWKTKTMKDAKKLHRAEGELQIWVIFPVGFSVVSSTVNIKIKITAALKWGEKKQAIEEE